MPHLQSILSQSQMNDAEFESPEAQQKRFQKSIRKIHRINSTKKVKIDPTPVQIEILPKRRIKIKKAIKIPIIKRSFNHGLVQNSVQFKKEIFNPFREKRKELKRMETEEGIKLTPTASEFELSLLNEFIENRFGLSKRRTAYDVLIARAMQSVQEQEAVQKAERKAAKIEKKKLLPEMSYMSDRNPYLIDFEKSMVNHGKEIVETISRNPRFQRINYENNQTKESVSMSQTIDNQRNLKKKRGNQSLNNINIQI